MAIIEIPFVMVSKIEKLKVFALSGVICILIFVLSFLIFFITSTFNSDKSKQPVGEMRMFP